MIRRPRPAARRAGDRHVSQEPGAADLAATLLSDPGELVEHLLDRVATEQARLVRILDRLAGALGGAGIEGLRASVVDIARDVCDAPVAIYMGMDDDDADATVAVERAGAARPAPRRAPLLSAAFASDELLAIDDVARYAVTDPAPLYGSVEHGRVLRSWIAAPVIRADTGVRHGVLFVAHERPHAFDARHHHLAGTLARHLAVALDGVHLAGEYVRVAEGLQETLLPPLLPDVERADVASRYRAAGDASLIGGDFYDVFPSTDRRWVAAIGDVCGVGPEAAAVTGIARYTLRAVGREDPRPGHALAALDDAIRSRVADDRFCSAIAACVQAAGADGLRVTWSSAGHPPPLVLRDDGRVEVLDQRLGPLLGVMPGARFSEETVDLRPGDALVLYTDGVIEARRSGGDLFGEARLAGVVGSCAGRTADGIVRRIELAVLDHVGGPPADDVAILVLRARHVDLA